MSRPECDGLFVRKSQSENLIRGFKNRLERLDFV